MVSLDRFAVFRAVVEAGSFTAAAARLNQARAAVSFNIKQLETELGITLLTRTTRRVELTDAGERFYARCLRVLEEAECAIDDARSEHGGMHGMLRVASTVEYGAMVVALPDYRFPPQAVYALYLSTPHVPQKVRAWVDFMKAEVDHK